MLIASFIFITALGSSTAWSKDQICDPWFAHSGLKPGANCLLDCMSLKVDMGTFGCHDSCPNYCDKSAATDFIFKLTDLYPGLTLAERALAAEFPVAALKGYSDALKAEKLCAAKYGKSRTNDESDACRHFVWAGLMSQDIGSEVAAKFLNAHEDYSGNPENEKTMDLKNNAVGLREADELGKAKTFSSESMERRFDDDLSKGKLTVIAPRLNKKAGK
jgi:hypothetical protein